MKLVASLKFVSSKNCIGIVSSSVFKNVNQAHEVHTFRISAGQNFGYINLISSSSQDFGTNWLCINGLYASKLGFNDGCSILLEPVEPLGCARAWIAPVSVDDWEILELHASIVETQALDQIRIIWPGQIFPLWINKNICVYLKTVQVEPKAECSLLVPLSELVIEPKTNRNKNVLKKKCSKAFLVSHNQENISDLNESKNVTITKRNTYTSKPCGFSQHQLQTAEANFRRKRDVSSVGTNFVTKSKALFFFIYINCFKQIFFVFKFLVMFMWRSVPQFFHHFLRLLYGKPNIFPNSIQFQQDWVNNQINNLPNDFVMVARVEPVLFEQSSLEQSCQLLINQPNTIFLHSTADMENCQPDVYLVLMSKYLSPYEKLSETKLKKTVSVPENDMSNNNLKKCLNECVVRMYLHPQSKYAMENDWKMVCESHCLKVPACVRRQMNLSVSSKVCLRKITDKPLFVNDILSMIFHIKSSSKLSGVTSPMIIDSFKKWITGISDDNNPVPVFVGSLFIFSIAINNIEADNSEPNLIVVEAVVDSIEMKGQKSGDKLKSDKRTFFLSSNDFTHVDLIFIKSTHLSFIPLQADVDLKIPSENVLVYCQGFEVELKTLQRFVNLALSFRPLSAALSHGGHRLRQTCTLITGAKGTGKTVLCRSLLNEFATDCNFYAYVHSIACCKWRGKKPENVKKLCDELLYELLWRQPSILLLDDLDQLIPASINNEEENSPDNFYTLQLVSVIKPFFQALIGGIPEILKEIPKVAVLITAKSKSALHPALTSSGDHLFGNNIHIELPNFDKRKIMFMSLVQNFTDLQCPSDLNEIIDKTEGFAVGDLANLVRKLNYLVEQNKVYNHFISKVESNNNKLCSEILNRALNSITPASLQSAKLHKPLPLTWSDVGGLKFVKQKLQEQLLWPVKYKNIFSECGLQPQSGVLLFGPPGCGKTLLASVVASECGLNFISIKGPEVLSKYIGASEAAVRDLFSRAKAASPCVLFFDEFDSLAPKRGHDSTGVTDRVVNQLLTHLDGVEPLVGVTVMAATSRPDLLDSALLRPGRLDKLLYCPFPNAKDRLDILTSLSKKLHLDDSVDLVKFAQNCENFSGADLKALLYNAQLEAVHENMNRSEHIERDIDRNPNSMLDNAQRYMNTDLKNTIKDDNFSESLKCHPAHALLVAESKGDCFDGGLDVADSSPHIVYFSALHQGRSATVPSGVLQATGSLFTQPHSCSSPVTTGKTESEVLLIANRHINLALAATRPSVTDVELENFNSLYSSFVRSRDRSSNFKKNYYASKLRTTLS